MTGTLEVDMSSSRTSSCPTATMMAHPLALQLRNLQSLVEIGVDKNTTVVFPAPLMSTIEELVAFLTRENNAAARPGQTGPSSRPLETNGSARFPGRAPDS
jgi:hypothetical protein